MPEVSQAPPSATRMAPVTYEDTRLARNRVQWAISVLLPARCRGMDWKAPAASPLGPPDGFKGKETSMLRLLTYIRGSQCHTPSLAPTVSYKWILTVSTVGFFYCFYSLLLHCKCLGCIYVKFEFVLLPLQEAKAGQLTIY